MKVDILAIGAHPDDIEISASGTLLKHLEMGKKIALLDLTEGELGTRGDRETRRSEAIESAKILGIEHRHNLSLADGFFDLSIENKMKLIAQIRFFKPDVVLANALSDRHPDHGRAAQLIKEACFLSGLRKIETQFQNQQQEAWRPRSVYHYIQDVYQNPDFVVDITPHIDKKIESLKAFGTQFYQANSADPETPISGKEYFDFLKGRWMDFGRKIGVTYAEGFQVNRPLGVDDITALI